MPDNLTFAKLDRVLQAAMGWTNSHLHEWRVEGRRYGIPDPEWDNEGDVLDERKFKLGSVLGATIDEFEYEYDFGDGWEHRLLVEHRLAPEAERNTWPMCIGGANACPPEDVGGPHGYMEFVQAMLDPRQEDHLRMWQWNGGPFDPASFSLNDANRAIRRLR